MKRRLKQIPGWIGISLITILNAIWLFWGLGEAFFEGWGVPDTPWILFLTIPIATMLFCYLAIKFPIVGGAILIVVGIAFAVWWLIPGIQSGLYTLPVVIERLYLSGGFAIVGICFILDSILNPQSNQPAQSRPWILRNLRLVVSLGIPMLVGLIVAAVNLPTVLTRVDDGIRTARFIQGQSTALVWAPAGPGWNWKQDFGGYPSWDSLAAYGDEPIGLDSQKLSGEQAGQQDMSQSGLCAYLSEDGTKLLSEPLFIWRMPTVDEIAGSLSRHGQNMGCLWHGEIGRLACEGTPDKETPLWAPDEPPVYYWAAEAFDQTRAYFVSYTGWVNAQPKDWGNPRHGYRCVREP